MSRRQPEHNDVVVRRLKAAVARILLAGVCLVIGLLGQTSAGQHTNWYNFNRQFQAVSNTSGAVTWADVISNAMELTGIVGPTNVCLISNDVYGIEHEAGAWGYSTASDAWNAVLSAYPSHYTNYPAMNCSTCLHVIYTNAGWVAGTKNVGTNWAGYVWWLHNAISFTSSASADYVFPQGTTSEIASVLVGTIGDYCPLTIGTDTGPVFDTSFPGANCTTNVVLTPNLAAYYKLVERIGTKANASDTDGDGIPGFADGYNRDGIVTNSDDVSMNDHFIVWKVRLYGYTSHTQAWFRISYSNSDPAAVILTNSTYIPGPGYLRVWKKDAWIARNKSASPGGDYIPSGEYAATNLGFTADRHVATLYIEPVTNCIGQELVCEVDPDGPGGPKGYICADKLVLNVLELGIAMDGNRDDTIDFDNPADAKYLFWVNDDVDVISDGEEDDAESGTANCDDNVITCKRDLEDFTRLHIKADDNTANLSGITYFLKFENVTSGSPSANVFEAVGESSGYLSDTNIAPQQIQKTNLVTVATTEQQLPSQYIKTGNLVSPFILEGKSGGKGDLTLIVKKDGKEVCRKAVTLELHDTPWFYDIYSVGVSSGDQWEVQIPTTATHSQTASNSPVTDEKFLLVHGWNMNASEKTNWIETVFKRLWWQGYQGSVALFDWPTLSDMNYGDVLAGAHHFDNSEFRSWLSSDALIDAFNTLNGDGNLRVLAHSMGNVAMVEALRRYTGANLHTYVACQAALSAHYYDNTVASSNPCHYQGFPYDVTFPQTPDIMGHFSTGDTNSNPYMTDNDTHVSNMQNYYNGVDWALEWWEINNVLKPDGLTYLFGYYGSEDHYQEGTDQFSRGPLDDPYEILSVTNQRQRYMIFSYCDESRSRALGQTTNSEFACWNLELPVDQGGMGYNHQRYSHSREFRSNIADEWDFWFRVFETCQFQDP